MGIIENTIYEHFGIIGEGFDFSSDNFEEPDIVEESIGGYIKGYNMMRRAPEEWKEFIEGSGLPECAGIVLKRCISEGSPKLPESPEKLDINGMHYAKRYCERFPSDKYLKDFIYGAMEAKAQIVCSPTCGENKSGISASEMVGIALPKLEEFARRLAKTDYTKSGVLHLNYSVLEQDGFTFAYADNIGYARDEEAQDEYGRNDGEIQWVSERCQMCQFNLMVNSTWDATHEYGMFAVHTGKSYPAELNNFKIKKPSGNAVCSADESSDGERMYPRFQIYVAIGEWVDFDGLPKFADENDLVWDDNLEYMDNYDFDYSHYYKSGQYEYNGETYNGVLALTKALRAKLEEYCAEHTKKDCVVKIFNDPHDVNGLHKFYCAEDVLHHPGGPRYEIAVPEAEMEPLRGKIRKTLVDALKGSPYEKYIQ